ncbi:oligopeptide transporter substrate-binding protein [Mycobacterium marinum]|uniref:oligopeptide transporter substrate-binding protein n=1 Tax=Mycobacterium marinum TaxID=1781 RepID=UPI003564160F
MARHDPPDYGAGDPTAYGNYGYGDQGGGYGQQPPPEPTPGWRKPLALAGWGVLIAVLIGLIIFGIIQLAHGRPIPASVTKTVTATMTTTTPTTTTTTTTNPMSPGAMPTFPSQLTPSIPTVINLPPGL